MKVVVTGATGFIGRKVVQRLIAEGNEIVVFSRDPHAASHFPSTVQPFRWDPNKEEPPLEAFENASAVIHLAGEGIATKRWSEAQKKKIMDSRVLGTRHLVGAINRLPVKPQVLVSTSAVGYYGDRKDEALTEFSGPGTGFLTEVCQKWESEAKEVSKEVRLVNLRVGVVLGLEGGMLAKLLPLFKLGLGGPVGDGRQWIPWIHSDDLVSLILFTVAKPDLKGPINAAAPKPVTNAEFSKALGRAVHRPAFFRAPSFAIKAAMGEMSAIVLGSTRALPQKAEEFGFQFRYPKIEVALNQITGRSS